jgi:putative redox protein
MSNNSIVSSIKTQNYRTKIQTNDLTWFSDESVEGGGGGGYPDPMQMLAGSLGACTAITLRMYAQRKNWALEGVDVDVEIHRGTPSSTITRKIRLYGDLTPEQHARLLQIADACPVHKILSGTNIVKTTLE